MNIRQRIQKLEQGTIPKDKVMNVFDDRALDAALELLADGANLLALVEDSDIAGQLREAGASVLCWSGNVKPSML